MSEVINELLKHESDDNVSEQFAGEEGQLTEQEEQITGQEEQITEQEEQITGQEEQIAEQEQQITEQEEQLAKRAEQFPEEEEQLTEEEKRFIEKAIENVCKIKADEFCLQGIKATGKQVWMCVSASYKKGNPNLHEMVKDILGLKSAAFMNWLLVQAQKGTYIP